MTYPTKRLRKPKYSKVKRGKSRSYLGIIVCAVIVVFASVFLTAIITSWGLLNKPLVSADDFSPNNSSFDKKRTMRILIVLLDTLEQKKIEKMYLLSLNPVLENTSLIFLPSNLSGGVGEWYVGDNTASFIKQVGVGVGFPIERYIFIEKEGLNEVNKQMGGCSWNTCFSLLRIPSYIKLYTSLSSNINTNLSLNDLGTAFSFLNSLKESDFYTFESDFVCTYKPIQLYDPGLQQDGLRISVLNGTPLPGLASRVSKVLENLGANILEVGNADRSDYQTSQLVGDNINSYAASFVMQTFNITQKRPPASSLERRADLTIILGLDNSY